MYYVPFQCISFLLFDCGGPHEEDESGKSIIYTNTIKFHIYIREINNGMVNKYNTSLYIIRTYIW